MHTTRNHSKKRPGFEAPSGAAGPSGAQPVDRNTQYGILNGAIGNGCNGCRSTRHLPIMPRHRHLLALALGFALSACGERDADKGVAINAAALPPPATAAPAPAAAPVTAEPTSQAASATAPVAPGPLYFCVKGDGSGAQRTTIAFEPAVETLCRKAPEMGPCQYERDACRRQGGKVVTAGGAEITPQVEAEYDRRVLRIRMKSN